MFNYQYYFTRTIIIISSRLLLMRERDLQKISGCSPLPISFSSSSLMEVVFAAVYFYCSLGDAFTYLSLSLALSSEGEKNNYNNIIM